MNDIWIKPLILACLFGAVMLLADVVIRTIVARRSEGRAINRRLTLIGEGKTRGEALKLLRRDAIELPAGLPPFVVKFAERLGRIIDQAQLKIPTHRLMLALVAGPIAVFLLAVLLVLGAGITVGSGRLLILATFAVTIGAMLPFMVLQAKARRVRKRIEEQFPVALDVFVRGLRAGHPIAAALDLLTVEMPDPMGSQFGMAVDEVTYGAELRDSLAAMAERWDSDDMRMFVVSLSVQSETGGNLAEILENLSTVIRARQSMMLKVRALSSEGRMTAAMLTGLPLLAFSILFVFNPGFYLDVAGDPWFVPGFTTLIILYLAGFYMIRRMVDLKV
jgi:tight adherence protein B